ncbi:MAG: hypothetical protein AB1Z23_07195 [Eubacteriales bacterium]
MKKRIILLPGEPNDDNRVYLPEEIKGSEMVVNENGNNSHIYPKLLKEQKGVVVDDGLEDIWYEYVPQSYDPSKKTPLVLSMHGGLMTGWGQAIYTSWTHVADREGFIVVFPNAHSRRFWTIECEKDKIEMLTKENDIGVYLHPFPEDIKENHDANLALGLIELMKEKYNIDEGRVYMQGMSLGNAMTSMMARYYSSKFAGMAGSAGPSSIGLMFSEDGTPNHHSLPVAAWQSRMELDAPPPGSDDDIQDVVAANREYWLIINECDSLPEIKIVGESNFAFYKGKKADYAFRDVKNRDHGQPFDDAEVAWDYLFSGVRRNDKGEIEHFETVEKREGDAFNIAVSIGSEKVWINNAVKQMKGKAFNWQKLKYHGLNGDQIVRGEYAMVPISFLTEVFDAAAIVSKDGGSVELFLKDGREVQFARGCIGAVVDNKITSMLCEAVQRDGELYVSLEWFCRYLFNYTVTSCDDVTYVTDHYAVLSKNMARLIKDILAK